MHIDVLDEREDISDICRRYWELDEEGNFKWTVSDIAKEYVISSYEIQKIVKNYSRAYSDEFSCQICEDPYIYKNRQDYNSFSSNSWTCDECEEQLHAQADEKKYEILKRKYDCRSEDVLSLEKLSVRHAVFLLALIRYSASEDLS